jgi:tetratricopeptide (TPR) repeat protein
LSEKEIDEFRRLLEFGRVEEALPGLQALLLRAFDWEEQLAIEMMIFACLDALGRFAEARERIQRLLKDAPRQSELYTWILLGAANFDFDQKAWPDAIQKFSTLLSEYASVLSKPENEDSRESIERRLGYALQFERRFKEALQYLERASTRLYDAGDVLYQLGRCKYELHDFEGARIALESSLKVSPPPYWLALAHYYLGLSQYCLRQHARAAHEFEWCLQNDPQETVPRKTLYDAMKKNYQRLGMTEEVSRYSRLLKKSNS